LSKESLKDHAIFKPDMSINGKYVPQNSVDIMETSSANFYIRRRQYSRGLYTTTIKTPRKSSIEIL